MTFRNSVTNAGVEVAANRVESALGSAVTRTAGRRLGAAAGRAGGLLVQPAVWVITGSGPDAADTFLYGAGVVGTIVGSAATATAGFVTGMVKAVMDDRMQTLVDEAKQEEPARYRPGIAPIGDFSFWANNNTEQIGAIEEVGGVVWRHRNGALLFARDAHGRLVCDYEPQSYVEKWFPRLPLQRGSNGGLRHTRARRR
ncbi:MAG: hypothetical protein AAF662_01130 [Pseudomonadota bacterium]